MDVCSFRTFSENSLDYGLHSMRRGAAKHLGEIGVPDRIVMEMADWKSFEVLMGYTRSSKKFHLEAARSILCQKIGRVMIGF